MQVGLADQEKELFVPLSVAPWFAADVKLGSLIIHLELTSCFAAGKPYANVVPQAQSVEFYLNAIMNDATLYTKC